MPNVRIWRNSPLVTIRKSFFKKQPPQRSSKEHSDAIKDEVMKLKRAGAIKEVFFTLNGWLTP